MTGLWVIIVYFESVLFIKKDIIALLDVPALYWLFTSFIYLSYEKNQRDIVIWFDKYNIIPEPKRFQTCHL